jgi:hypothetical protein
VDSGFIIGPQTFCIQNPEQTKPQSMESRVQEMLESLRETKTPSAAETMEHIALLKRWYYRSHPIGEIFLADDKGIFPMRRIVRGIGRVLRGERVEDDLLEQTKVREGIMEFPIRKEPGNADEENN